MFIIYYGDAKLTIQQPLPHSSVSQDASEDADLVLKNISYYYKSEQLYCLIF